MKRRDFIAAVGAVVAWPFVAHARQQGLSQNSGLEEAKRRFDKISQPSEAARTDYVTRLVRMREEKARQKSDEWKASGKINLSDKVLELALYKAQHSA